MPYVCVLLTPGWDGEKVPNLGVELKTDLEAEAGKPLFLINLMTIFKPFTELSEPISIRDEMGELKTLVREKEIPPVKAAEYVPERDGRGEILIRYALKLAPAGKNPVFDLGCERGGMNGSGMTFMPAFLTEETIDYRLSWDLAALPDRAVGVWSFGEGKTDVKGGGQLLMETFYAAGLLDGIRLGNFGCWWFPNPKLVEPSVFAAQVFAAESGFFGDKGEQYTIFARHTDDPSSDRAGGTALARSYMYLYLNDEQIDPVWLKFLFAHEMVHNWVHLADEPFGTCTWYVEGMAEYYSAVLPFRSGLVTEDELLRELNKRAEDYYRNPAIGCSNEECGRALMGDREKTRIPYGRGFFYLLGADEAIRAASGGRKCLDDVVLALNREWEQDQNIGNEAWIREYGKYVGEERAREEYEWMRAGGRVKPGTACFDGALGITAEKGTIRGTGGECEIWRFTPTGNKRMDEC